MVTRAEIMKVTPFLMMILFVCECEILHSQTNYYPNSSGTISMNGYTYKYDTYFGLKRVYNITNQFMDVEWKYKDGSEVDKNVFFGNIPTIDNANDNWTKPIAYSIVNNAFTPQQKEKAKGVKLSIDLNLDTASGKIIDVFFTFSDEDPYINIPVETYRAIELELKKKLYFVMTDVGKKLNYGIVSWSQEIK